MEPLPGPDRASEFEAFWQSTQLSRLEGRIDPGRTIRTETWRPERGAELPPTEVSGGGRIRTEEILARGLPRVSVAVAPGAAGDGLWPERWVAAGTRAGEPPDLAVTSLLGQGGMGQVALAEQRSLERQVAIKCLKPGETRKEAAEAIVQEGRILGSLAHPNVVPIHALGVDDGDRPVLVLKCVEGVPWRELIRDPEHPHWRDSGQADVPPVERQLDVFVAVCNAVAFAHRRGIVHRDLKPENVMVGGYGEVHVLDWGIATRLSDHQRCRTSSGRVVGTPRYLAPEMLEDGAVVDARTDVYLLGGTLHEVLTGSPPHRGASLHEVVLAAHLSEPRTYPPEVPEPLAAICNRAMSRRPEDRFPDVRSLREAVTTYLRHRGSLRLAAAAGERLVELEATSDHHAAAGLFAECQFGYLQALRDWPENLAARDGLERSVVRMCSLELEHGQIRSAEVLFARLASPQPWLAARLEAARAEARRREQEAESFRRMRRDLDFEAGLGARVLFFGVLGVLFGFLLLGHVLPASRADHPHGFDFAVKTDVLLLLFFCGVLAWQRRRLLATAIHRSFFGLFALALVLKFLQRLVSWRLGIDIRSSMTLDMLTNTVLFVAAGAMIRPWLHWGALVCAVDVLALLFWPIGFQLVYAAGNGGAFLFVLGWLVLEFLRRTKR